MPVTVPPPTELIEDVVLGHAARRPAATAVQHGARTLTYAELDRRSSAVSRLLRSVGADAGTAVGVLLGRGAQLVVALLGVMRAGCVYVPLDPGHPAERLAWLAREASVAVLLAGDANVAAAAAIAPPGAPVLGVPADPRKDAHPVAVRGDRPAYVVFTSGSTGRPKGVLVAAAMLARHCAAARQHYGIAPSDRVLLFAGPSVDVHLEQALTALTGGATLVVPDREWIPAELPRRVAALGLTVANLSTAYWRDVVAALAEMDGRPAGDRLRLMIAGGEAMSAVDAAAWWRSPWAEVRLLNAYGPTEATVTAAALDVVRPSPSETTMPIGAPLRGRRLYVLDEHGADVADGCAGELCIAGGLACGYLRAPALTAEKFIPDPHGDEPGARLYRTGDHVRRRGDGAYDFLGRLDDQLELRGFRIEPGEVEAALRGHTDVHDVAVAVTKRAPGDTRLIAYVVPGAGRRVEAAELRRHAARLLPAHMRPAAYEVLAALPRAPSGKVDHRALSRRRDHDTPGADPGDGGGAMRAEVDEAAIAEIWKELLGVPDVGRNDDFFDLGGHSLLAMRVLARVQDRLGVEVPITAMFERPTIAGLAEAIAQQQPATAGDGSRHG